MKQIELLTSNNVTIQYELASTLERFLATLLDWLIIAVYYYVCFLLLTVLLFSTQSKIAIYIVYALVLPVYFFYHLVSEIFFDGQSLGKKIMKIKVVKLTDEKPSLSDYFLRWTYRMIDIGFSLGALAVITISSSKNGQRLGDVAANTTVIKLNPSQRFSIKEILKIAKDKNYKPKYSAVTNLTDDDMLLIKNVINRVQQYPNAANKKIVIDLIEIIKEKLNISDIPKNKITFLKTLLKDYVFLTR